MRHFASCCIHQLGATILVVAVLVVLVWAQLSTGGVADRTHSDV